MLAIRADYVLRIAVFSSMNGKVPRSQVEIGLAPLDQAGRALRLVFRRFAADDRAEQVHMFLAGIESGKIPLEGLLEARRGGRLVGAVFSQFMPGRTAMLWPPRLIDGEPDSTARALLDATNEYLLSGRICMAEVLVETLTHDDDTILRYGEFEPLAELLFMVCTQNNFPKTCPAGPLEFEPYGAAGYDCLARLVERTYQQTQDCPRLNKVRKIDDVLAGYRATGVYDPMRWLIARHEGRDVGCLLLADHPQHENWELVYMGLVVSARGHAWGRNIARHAQFLAGRAGRMRLVLAVDAGNAPAIAMYSAVGFRVWDRRSVYVKFFESSS